MPLQSNVSYVVPPQVSTLPVIGSEASFPVRRVYCVGRNDVEHIREMKEGDERDPPFFFQKPTASIVADGSTVPYPPYTDDFHHEIELVVAIGKSGRNIPEAQAADHIFGYAVGIDLTRRDRQREARERGLAWEVGKSFDQSAPCGPLHPATAVGHPKSGAITLHVNGELRQKGDLSELIWNVPEIIANLSRQYALVAGDVIFTGTPAGVGAVVPGDRLEGAIDGLGTLTITIGPREE